MRAVESFAALFLLAGSAFPAEPVPVLVPMNEMLDFGEVSPQNPAQPAALGFLVHSGRPWRATIERGAAEPRDLEILTAADGWVTLQSGLPVEIAAGGPTAAGGASIVASLRPAVNFDSATGVREGTLRVRLSHGAARDVHYRYEVPLAAVFREVSREPIFAINPVARGVYPVERRAVHVTSNARWTLEITLLSPLTLRGNTRKLEQAILSVITPDGDSLPLPVNTPVSITGGDATGAPGAPLQFQLAVSIDGNELGGDYEADLRIDVAPFPRVEGR